MRLKLTSARALRAQKQGMIMITSHRELMTLKKEMGKRLFLASVNQKMPSNVKEAVAKIRKSRPKLTIKAAREILQKCESAADYVAQLSSERRYARHIIDSATIDSRLTTHKDKKRAQAESVYKCQLKDSDIKIAENFKTVLVKNFEESKSSVEHSDKDWNFYSKRTRYPKIHITSSFHITNEFLNSPHLHVIGGKANVAAKKIGPHLHEVISISNSRGYYLNYRREFVFARSNNIVVRAKTADLARKNGMAAPRKAAEKAAKKAAMEVALSAFNSSWHIDFNSDMSTGDFTKKYSLGGRIVTKDMACMAGNCRDGVDDFCEHHAIPGNSVGVDVLADIVRKSEYASRKNSKKFYEADSAARQLIRTLIRP